MKKAKRIFALSMASLMAAASLTACGGNNDSETKGGDSITGTEANAGTESSLPAKITDIKLGEDYTDLTADIKILTHKTDVVDTLFADYVKQFNELYPNITVKYEAVTNYAEDMTMRMTTDDWGDICMIPTTVDKVDYPDKFVSFGPVAELENDYIM